jgi:hypothetical protein
MTHTLDKITSAKLRNVLSEGEDVFDFENFIMELEVPYGKPNTECERVNIVIPTTGEIYQIVRRDNETNDKLFARVANCIKKYVN